MEECEIEMEGETPKIVEFESIQIKENENIYNLDLKINYEENNLTLSINDKNQFPPVYYIKTMSLKKIKDLNKELKNFNSFDDFYNYLKTLTEEKKLNILKEKNKLSLFNQDIKIGLVHTKKDLELNIKDIYEELINMKDKIKEIDTFKKENMELKNRIDTIEKENIALKNQIEILEKDNKELKIIDIIEKENIELKNRIDILEKNYQNLNIKNDNLKKDEHEINNANIIEPIEQNRIINLREKNILNKEKVAYPVRNNNINENILIKEKIKNINEKNNNYKGRIFIPIRNDYEQNKIYGLNGEEIHYTERNKIYDLNGNEIHYTEPNKIYDLNEINYDYEDEPIRNNNYYYKTNDNINLKDNYIITTKLPNRTIKSNNLKDNNINDFKTVITTKLPNRTIKSNNLKYNNIKDLKTVKPIINQVKNNGPKK